MKIKKGFVMRKVAGNAVVIATGEASKNFHGMVRLNATGADIWQGVADGLDENAIADRLVSIYEVDREKAYEDVISTVAKMKEAGFIEE